MAHVQFTDVQDRPLEFLDLTSLTLDEFQQLVLPFEAAFQTHMAAWRLDGKPRTARRFSVYQNCPLSTPEDRLLFILAYVKTYALQVVQGRLFGMGQSKANQWIHVLLPVLLAALRTPGSAPWSYAQGLEPPAQDGKKNRRRGLLRVDSYPIRAFAVKTVQAVSRKLCRLVSSFSYPLIYQPVKAVENATESH